MEKRRTFNQKFLLISIPLLIILVVLIFVNISDSKKISKEYLYNTAGKTIQEKIDVFLIKENQAKALKDTFEQNSEEYLIAEFRDKLFENGESYDTSNLILSIENQYIDKDGMLHVLAKEETYLTFSIKDIKTGYAAKHEFIYKKQDSAWSLVEDRQLEPTGLLPLYQANNFVYSSVNPS